MTTLWQDAFWLSLLLVVYVYAGYPALVVAVSALKGRVQRRASAAAWPSATVLVAAHNEDDVIVERIRNLLGLMYPSGRLDVVVASDGSTDATAAAASAVSDPRVRVLDFKKNRGKALTHNESVPRCEGQIVIFTDADTEFVPACAEEIVRPFVDDPRVGCVVGNLVYRTAGSAVSEASGRYWQIETALRRGESSLGILHTATGAVMAIRRELWRQLEPTDDSDFSTPLDVLDQGYRIAFAEGAIAYDQPPATTRGEFRARVRMTSKNFGGTLRRWGAANWVRHPVVSWAILSHKLLRWLVPYALGVFAIAAMMLVGSGGIYTLAGLAVTAGVVLAIVGWIADRAHTRVPLASLAFSYCVASAGMAIGVVKALAGTAPAAFRQTD